MPWRGDAATIGAHRPGHVRVGPTVLPVWLLSVLVALGVAGGLAVALLHTPASGPSHPAAGAAPSVTLPQDPTDMGVASTGDASTPSPDDGTPTEPDPTPSAADAGAVVEEYYRDINAGNFGAAWDLGGRNIAGMSYSDWVAGFDTTRSIEVNAVNTTDSGQVDADIRATQSDGSVKEYQGTYTVSDGAIVSADIVQR
ncbi:hypothetical protein ACFYZB_39550 [Streptomyces sp. NPDC001852]|uniref:hypothetical protein n=1 Tax=Streptomyces sp. NPDC001852 TaxID=3364619 RepID=UPI0036CD6543